MIAQTANQWSPRIYFIGASERSRHPRFDIPKNDAKAAGEAAFASDERNEGEGDIENCYLQLRIE